MGQFRALQELGLLDRAHYLSTVSGGTWAGAVLVYAPQNRTDLLGRGLGPAELTVAGIKARFTATDMLMGKSVSVEDAPGFVTDDIADLFKDPSRYWTRTIGDNIFKPYGLYSRDRTCYFTLNASSWAAIVARNPALAGVCVQTVRTDGQIPYLVINGGILGPANRFPVAANTFPDVVGFEMTPLYAGTPVVTAQMADVVEPFETKVVPFATIGGALLETFAFGTPTALVRPSGPTAHALQTVALAHAPFQLALASGISSMAAADGLGRVPVANRVIPDIGYNVLVNGTSDYQTVLVGDGGDVDNFGLIGMLRRGVQRAVVFVNTDIRVDARGSTDPCKAIDDDLPPYFGHNCLDYGIDRRRDTVFPSTYMGPLIEAIQQRASANEPIVVTQSLPVLNNTFWGIQGGWTVDVLWV